jgi:hypothetical protein
VILINKNLLSNLVQILEDLCLSASFLELTYICGSHVLENENIITKETNVAMYITSVDLL